MSPEYRPPDTSDCSAIVSGLPLLDMPDSVSQKRLHSETAAEEGADAKETAAKRRRLEPRMYLAC